MSAGSSDYEIRLIHEIAGRFFRHPLQTNGLLEADSEIIDFSNSSFRYLVLKTDGICEEIKEGLYDDPHLIGWMAATVTLSDLAATGAAPMGLLLNLQIPKERNDVWLTAFQNGINDACKYYGVYIFGGDTNFDTSISVSTTGIGTIRDGVPLTRMGVEQGDFLYATGLLGCGNAYAYHHYFDPRLQIGYHPVARLAEGALIKEHAAACIDTSDGLFPALSVLSDLNNTGFELQADLGSYLHPDARKVCLHANIPAWMLLAGPHGEYELLFSVRADRKDEFEHQYKSYGVPLYLGRATASKILQFTSGSDKISCEPALVANLYHQANGNVPYYFELLKQLHDKWRAP